MPCPYTRIVSPEAESLHKKIQLSSRYYAPHLGAGVGIKFIAVSGLKCILAKPFIIRHTNSKRSLRL
jgi:hypothetical protein